MASEIQALLPYFVNFTIVLVLLVAMGRKPLRKFVYQRHERLKDSVESAAISHGRASNRLAAAKKAMGAIAAEERSLVDREIASAGQERREIIEKAGAEAERIGREAERLAEAEREEAYERVKVAFLDLVVRETEDSLRRGLKKDDHSAILRRAQDSIEVGI